MILLNNIHNTFDSYQQFINLYQKDKECLFETIQIGFNTFFSANMSAALGAILYVFSSNINTIEFDFKNSKIKDILLKNDFLTYYGYKRIPDSFNTTIRFQKLKPTDGKYFKSYVINELIGRSELPSMSNMVRDRMAEAIYEIFVNAQIHSESKSIYTCGQFFPNKNMIEFTIVDSGVGFKQRVNNRFHGNLSSIQAISWATQDRNTTKEDITGGIGLALLKEFIEKNKGKMQIISDDGFYQFDKAGEQTQLFDGAFPGTIVNLQFRTDDKSSYKMKNEIRSKDIF